MTASRDVAIRPLVPPDYDEINDWSMTAGTSNRWRFHDAPTEEDFLRELWDGVLQHRVVYDERTGERIGLVTIYDADHRNGSCYLAAVSAPRYIGSGMGALGAAFVLFDAFDMWPIDRMHAEVFTVNEASLRSLTRRGRLDARLVADIEIDGAYHDRLIFTLERDQLHHPSLRLFRRRYEAWRARSRDVVHRADADPPTVPRLERHPA